MRAPCDDHNPGLGAGGYLRRGHHPVPSDGPLGPAARRRSRQERKHSNTWYPSATGLEERRAEAADLLLKGPQALHLSQAQGDAGLGRLLFEFFVDIGGVEDHDLVGAE